MAYRTSFMKTDLYRTEEIFTLTPTHLEILRKMIVIWDSSESGAPVVDIYNFPFNYEKICSLLGFTIKESDFKNQTEELEQCRTIISAIFEISIQHGSLKPGRYTYKNPFSGLKDVKWRLNAYGSKLFPMPTSDSITFDVTEEHIKLLKKSNARWLHYWELAGIDSKRPYGDMTCFYLDMANILEIEIPTKDTKSCEDSFSREQIKAFYKLHQEMFYMLQTYLLFAEMNPGDYFRKNDYGEWYKLP